MKEKSAQVHFRITEKEKERLKRNAEKCGLSQSEYFRQLINGYQPKTLPPMEYLALKDRITDLYLEFNERGELKHADLLIDVLRGMIIAITPEKGCADGNNKDMACP